MQAILDITSSLMDAFLLTVYFRSTLGGFRRNLRLFYVFALVCVESLLYANQFILAHFNSISGSRAITFLLSVVTTFLVSFFYKAKLSHRILFSVLFQLLCSLSEFIFTWLVLQIQPDLLSLQDGQMLYAVMGFGTTITSFLLILILNLIKRINDHRIPLRFHFMLLITPVITILALSFINPRGFYALGYSSSYIILVLTLVLINLINYIEIEWSSTYLSDRDNLLQMEQQVNYKKQKYDQLSNSYRQSRSFLHDIRKHFFTMQEYIQEGKTCELSDYMEHSFGELEHLYARFNTGNLVIDSFITNYAATAKQYNIRFDAILHLDKSRIPMEDYDLCVVLGNLLDNAMKACLLAPTPDRYIQISIETTPNDLFLIQQENSMDEHLSQSAFPDNLEHGFGLVNIERTLDRYHGIMNYTTGRVFHMFIRVPITDPKQRLIEVAPTAPRKF